MPAQSLSDITQGLLDDYYASDEKSSMCIEDQLSKSLSPLIKYIILNSTQAPAADLEDMIQQTSINFIVGLRASKQPGACHITNLQAYIRQIAKNIQIDRSRRSSARRQMHQRLYYLTTNPRFLKYFRRWPIKDACFAGLAAWAGEQFRNTPEYISYCKDDTAFCNHLMNAYRANSVNSVKLPIILQQFFKWIKTPLEDKIMDKHMMDVTGYYDNECIYFGDIAESTGKPEDEIAIYEQEPATGRLNWENIWKTIGKLKVNTRTALLLGFGQEELMILSGQADPRAILALALKMDINSVQTFWRRLPLDDAEIAEYLHTSVNNVQVMRHRAMSKIKEQGRNFD